MKLDQNGLGDRVKVSIICSLVNDNKVLYFSLSQRGSHLRILN